MKKYRVSLAVLRSMNFECQIKAKSEQEAIYKGVKAFESDNWEEVDGYIDDEFDGSTVLDISDLDNPESKTELPRGAFVEELDN